MELGCGGGPEVEQGGHACVGKGGGSECEGRGRSRRSCRSQVSRYSSTAYSPPLPGPGTYKEEEWGAHGEGATRAARGACARGSTHTLAVPAVYARASTPAHALPPPSPSPRPKGKGPHTHKAGPTRHSSARRASSPWCASHQSSGRISSVPAHQPLTSGLHRGKPPSSRRGAEEWCSPRRSSSCTRMLPSRKPCSSARPRCAWAAPAAGGGGGGGPPKELLQACCSISALVGERWRTGRALNACRCAVLACVRVRAVSRG